MNHTHFDINQIINILENHIPVCITEKSIPAKTTLLYEGDVSEHIYFIKKGILRLWNNDNGKDISMQFFFDGEAVTSFESFYHATPSQFSIESIEDSVVLCISKKNALKLLKESPELEQLMYDAIASRFIDYMNYFLSRIKEKPEERYRMLLLREPQVIERVPDYYVASYLGITPVSLFLFYRNR